MSNSILKVILGVTIFFFVLVAFTACEKQAQSSAILGISTKGNNIEVELLFEQDSVKVYRFYDGGYHYFTTRGETMTTQRKGKTSYEENIK
jgi:hypothetical protein